MRLSGVALEDEPGNPRDLAELPASELRRVEAGEYVQVDRRRGEQSAEIADVQRHWRRRYEAEAVIVRGDRERARRLARQSIREQRRETQMGKAAFECIEE